MDLETTKVKSDLLPETSLGQFNCVEGRGFKGYYNDAFGLLDGMLAGREFLVAKVSTVGVK